ncbi:MAG: DUF4355 domain-containing protein [Lachnospiraceae bacterium]|nr:DUF4355 domain-containing protein [Lachnospiraceae bacterium]
MSEFTPIETQEQFDRAIGERLTREKEKYKDYMSPEEVKEKYSGYLSPEEVEEKYRGYMSPEDVEKKYAGYISAEDAAEKDSKIKQYESHSVKTRIAKEIGLSSDAADFLQGETEEELKKSAEALKKILKPSAPPLRTSERAGDDDKDEALRETLRKLKGE